MKKVRSRRKVSASTLDAVLDTVTPQPSHPPTGMLVDIKEDVIVSDGEVHIVPQRRVRHRRNCDPWLRSRGSFLFPHPRPLHLFGGLFSLDGVALVEGNPRPAWAMVASDEQRRSDARTGNQAVVVDLALAMTTGFGAAADAAWLMRFVMAIFGWVAVLVGGGGEGQVAGRRRRLIGW